MAREALSSESEKKSVCVDNTNCKADQRKVYINIAKECKITQIRCIVIDAPKDICLKNNEMRKVDNSKHMSGYVSKVVIHTFFKRFEQPSIKLDGLTQEPIKIPYVPYE